VQAWSDKINNLFLLTVGSLDTTVPSVDSFTTALSGGQDAAITAFVPYPSAPQFYFVQVQLHSHFIYIGSTPSLTCVCMLLPKTGWLRCQYTREAHIFWHTQSGALPVYRYRLENIPQVSSFPLHTRHVILGNFGATQVPSSLHRIQSCTLQVFSMLPLTHCSACRCLALHCTPGL